MMETFETLYRQLGKATAAVLIVALGFLALALLSALAGLARVVPGFTAAAGALGYVFVGLLALFLLTTLVATLVRYLSRPAKL